MSGRAPLAVRAGRAIARARPLVIGVSRLQAAAVRVSRGRIRRSTLLAGGQPILSLTTTGRHSGRPRSTTVAYLRDGDALVVAGLFLGSDRMPEWCLNLRADPRAEVVVDGERRTVCARAAEGAEADRLWARLVDRLPAIHAFRAAAAREVPLFVLERDTGNAATARVR